MLFEPQTVDDANPRAVPDRGEIVTWTSPAGTEMSDRVVRVEGLEPDKETRVITEEGDGVPVDWLDGFGDTEATR